LDKDESITRFTQRYESGGKHTAPEARLILLALASAMRARLVVETGYDAGYTTEALALSGAKVLAVDNLHEYAEADAEARRRLAAYSNVRLSNGDALEFLRGLEDGTVDLIFVDDHHAEAHVRAEALEVRRVLRPGGVAVFHDTTAFCGIWNAVSDGLIGWEKVRLPAPSPHNGVDYGITIARKPV